MMGLDGVRVELYYRCFDKDGIDEIHFNISFWRSGDSSVVRAPDL